MDRNLILDRSLTLTLDTSEFLFSFFRISYFWTVFSTHRKYIDHYKPTVRKERCFNVLKTSTYIRTFQIQLKILFTLSDFPTAFDLSMPTIGIPTGQHNQLRFTLLTTLAHTHNHSQNFCFYRTTLWLEKIN